MVKYIVLFKLKDPNDAQAVADVLHTMEGKIDGLLSMETGVNRWDREGRCYDLALTRAEALRTFLAACGVNPARVLLSPYGNVNVGPRGRASVAVRFR